MNSDSVGGVSGNSFLVTTRQTDIHSQSSNTALHGRDGHSRFMYVRYITRHAMIL